jgi:ribosome biogenesis protein ERB1
LLLLLRLQADTDKTGSRLTYIPPAKPKLPGHEESYNPPKEYVPTGATLLQQ